MRVITIFISTFFFFSSFSVLAFEKEITGSTLKVMSEKGSEIMLKNVGKQLAKSIFEHALMQNPEKIIYVQNIYFKKKKDLNKLPKDLLKKLNIEKHSPKIKTPKIKVIFVAPKKSYLVYNGTKLIKEYKKRPQMLEDIFRILYPAKIEAARITEPDLR